MKRALLSGLLGLAFCIGSAQAEIVVKVRPPAPLIDRRPPAPSRDHVWVAGYHKWDGNAYVWVPGRWEARPHPRAVWVAPRWQHRRDGWVFVEGRWK